MTTANCTVCPLEEGQPPHVAHPHGQLFHADEIIAAFGNFRVSDLRKAGQLGAAKLLQDALDANLAARDGVA